MTMNEHSIHPHHQQITASPMLPYPEATKSVELNQALEQILASCLFKRAYRMCRLLRYLIEHCLSSHTHQMSEYAIGLDVFDRNPSTYCPSEDPVVRVQMGRLRKRLISYYAVLREAPSVKVSIPLGHYKPVIEYRQDNIQGNMSAMQIHLSVLPLYYISEDFLGRSLIRDVNLALELQLKIKYGTLLNPCRDVDPLQSKHFPCYVLEGSAMTYGKLLKLNVRLIDQTSHAIMNSAQFVLAIDATTAMQASLVNDICNFVGRVLSNDEQIH